MSSITPRTHIICLVVCCAVSRTLSKRSSRLQTPNSRLPGCHGAMVPMTMTYPHLATPGCDDPRTHAASSGPPGPRSNRLTRLSSPLRDELKRLKPAHNRAQQRSGCALFVVSSYSSDGRFRSHFILESLLAAGIWSDRSLMLFGWLVSLSRKRVGMGRRWQVWCSVRSVHFGVCRPFCPCCSVQHHFIALDSILLRSAPIDRQRPFTDETLSAEESRAVQVDMDGYQQWP